MKFKNLLVLMLLAGNTVAINAFADQPTRYCDVHHVCQSDKVEGGFTHSFSILAITGLQKNHEYSCKYAKVDCIADNNHDSLHPENFKYIEFLPSDPNMTVRFINHDNRILEGQGFTVDTTSSSIVSDNLFVSGKLKNYNTRDGYCQVTIICNQQK